MTRINVCCLKYQVSHALPAVEFSHRHCFSNQTELLWEAAERFRRVSGWGVYDLYSANMSGLILFSRICTEIKGIGVLRKEWLFSSRFGWLVGNQTKRKTGSIGNISTASSICSPCFFSHWHVLSALPVSSTQYPTRSTLLQSYFYAGEFPPLSIF
jgi:hypothetical protein